MMNILERYTEVQRSQHLTQADRRVFGKDYMASASSVCGRTAFYNEPSDHDHVAFFQSFAKLRETGLPSSLPAEKVSAIGQDPRFLEMQRTVKSLQFNKASASEIKGAKAKARNYRASLTKDSLQKYKMEWVRQRRDWKVTTRGKEIVDDHEPTDLLDVLSLMMPERQRLTKTMISDKVVSEQERRQAVEDLCFLVSQDTTTFYLPKENPIDGQCPSDGCDVQIERLGKRQRSTHIHECCRRDLARTLQRRPCELRYCYTCFNWFVEEEWEEHCQMHVASLTSKRCATIIYCHTLIRPAFCPFCLGNRKEAASRRCQSWTREAKLWTHLQTHFGKTHWPLRCPHPLCDLQLQDETSFFYHLSDVHVLKMSPYQSKIWQQGRSAMNSLASPSQKRQSVVDIGGDARPLKRGKVVSLDRFLDSESSGGLRNMPSTDTPRTISNGAKLPLSSDNRPLTDLFDPDQIPHPGEDHDEDKDLAADIESMVSTYLRSSSPPRFSMEGFSINRIQSCEAVPINMCRTAPEDSHSADINQTDVRSKAVSIQVKAPRIILRVRQPTPKARKSLRLSQPKPVLPQHSARKVIARVNNQRSRRSRL